MAVSHDFDWSANIHAVQSRPNPNVEASGLGPRRTSALLPESANLVNSVPEPSELTIIDLLNELCRRFRDSNEETITHTQKLLDSLTQMRRSIRAWPTTGGQRSSKPVGDSTSGLNHQLDLHSQLVQSLLDLTRSRVADGQALQHAVDSFTDPLKGISSFSDAGEAPVPDYDQSMASSRVSDTDDSRSAETEMHDLETSYRSFVGDVQNMSFQIGEIIEFYLDNKARRGMLQDRGEEHPPSDDVFEESHRDEMSSRYADFERCKLAADDAYELCVAAGLDVPKITESGEWEQPEDVADEISSVLPVSPT